MDQASAWARGSATRMGALNIRGGYITVDLYFTDTFQYTKLYGMRDSVERVLAALGEATVGRAGSRQEEPAPLGAA